MRSLLALTCAVTVLGCPARDPAPKEAPPEAPQASTPAPPRRLGAYPADAGVPPRPPPRPAPSEAVRFFREADLLLQRGQAEEALEAVTRSLELDPRSFLAHNLHGRVAARLSGRGPSWSKVAEGAFRRALELNPSFWPAHENLGDLLRRQDRWTDAAEAYQALLAAQPAHPRAPELERYIATARAAREHRQRPGGPAAP